MNFLVNWRQSNLQWFMNWWDCCLKYSVVCTYKHIKYRFVLDLLVTCECCSEMALIAHYIMRRSHCNSAPVICSLLLKSSKLSPDHRKGNPATENHFGLRCIATRSRAGASCTLFPLLFLQGIGTDFSNWWLRDTSYISHSLSQESLRTKLCIQGCLGKEIQHTVANPGPAPLQVDWSACGLGAK